MSPRPSGRVSSAARSLIEAAIGGIPGGLGRRLRYRFWKRRLKHLGRGAVIDVGVQIVGPEHVSIGDETWIDNYVSILAGPPGETGGPMRRRPHPGGPVPTGEILIGAQCHIAIGVVLQGHGGLRIGDRCGIASGCLLYSMSHHHANPNDKTDRTVYKFTPMAPGREQALIVSPIVMEDDTALGLNSVILPGGWIRRGSWVGVNSMVFGEIPENSIASGNPARVVKPRFE